MTSQPIKVLIVEDTVEHAQLLEQILGISTHPRYAATLAHSLAEALQKLKAGGIDMVLLDLTLPDSKPSNTFRAVNEIAPDTAVVVISGLADLSTAIELVQAGAQDYLIKGQVDQNLLIRSLQYSYERKRAQVALRHAHDQLEARVHERTAALVDTNKRLQAEISERKKAEEVIAASNQKLKKALDALHSAQQEIIQRERLNALGQMANGIAHEFNNILTPIIGWIEHLLHAPQDLGNQEETRDTLQKIQTAANVGAAAVGRVREFARVEADAYGGVNLTDIVEQAISFTEPKWKDEAQALGVMLDIRRQLGDTPEVFGDPSQLRELVALLLLNAVHAIPRRGTVTVSSTSGENNVVLTIRDDGLGMSKLTRERCLDPNLGSRHPNGRSSGYGTIHGILQRHNAKLEIETEEGRGTKVLISLPTVKVARPPEREAVPEVVVPEPEVPRLATLSNAKPAERKGKRILIAEDDSMVREVMEVYLTEDGYEVTMAANGRECLEIFVKENGDFDILITDRAMPEMNGDQVAAEAKRLNPSIPIILLTGFGELMLSEGEKPTGVDLVVGKPFTMASLRGALEKVGF